MKIQSYQLKCGRFLCTTFFQALIMKGRFDHSSTRFYNRISKRTNPPGSNKCNYASPAHLCKLTQAPKYLFQPQSIHQSEQVTIYNTSNNWPLQFASDSHSEVPLYSQWERNPSSGRFPFGSASRLCTASWTDTLIEAGAKEEEHRHLMIKAL